MKDKEDKTVILVMVQGNLSEAARKSEIRSKSANQSYRDNYDAIFGTKETKGDTYVN